MLPTFLILGAARSGTTALYEALRQHPEVYMPDRKEPNYFALGDRPVRFQGPGDDEYLNQQTVSTIDSYRALFASARPPQKRGEASPSSLYIPRAAPRIKALLPNVRLIVLLRNPVERAFSSFLLFRRDRREPCSSFREALKREPDRIAAGFEYGWHYVQLGFYYHQVKRFLDLFSREQLLILQHENFQSAPDRTLLEVCHFLDVDPASIHPPARGTNASGHPRSDTFQRILSDDSEHWLRSLGRTLLPLPVRRWTKRQLAHLNLQRPSLAADIRLDLQELYRDDIRHLQDLIDRDLSHWLDDPA